MKNNANTRWSVALMLLLVLALAACSRGPSDDSISAAIKSSYFSDPAVKNEAIDITVDHGEVTLAGKVSSDAARLQAYKLADGTPGVKKVNDKMEVWTAGAPEAPRREHEGRKSGTPGTMEGRPGERRSDVAEALPPRQVTIPVGTTVRVQMIDSIDSKTSQPGQTFAASLASPIVVGETVVVPKGADVMVGLVSSKSAGKIKGRSELELQLTELKVHGKSYPVQSSSYREAGTSRGKQTAERVGAGAGIGALIGGIAGGGKGAAIGAGIGAGAGTATQLITKGPQVKIPSETKLDFDLANPVQITLPPKKN